ILFIVIPLFVAKIPHDYFHMPLPVMVGVLLASYGLVNSIAQPFTGALSDRLGKRKILIISGLGVISLATLAFVFASSFLDLFLLRTLQGIGVAMTIPASMALMAVITQKETRGGSMGIYSTLRMAGFATGPLIGGYLKVHFGFNVTFYAGAGLLVIAMLMVYFWVKDVPVPEEAKSSHKFKIIDTSILDSGIVSAAIATFIMASSFSMVTTLENEFNARLQINAFDFSIAFSVLIIGRLLFQIPLGRLSDFIGRKPIIILGMILMAPATALLGESGSFYHFILLRIFQGIAAAGVAAPAFAVAGDLASTGGEGRQMSIITMGFGLGLAIGPLLAGLLAVVFFELPFLTVGFLSLVGAWVVYHYMPETVEGGKVLFSNHRR
ncbi:MAG: MFS transporter, partial [Anaerolineales bacterium]